MLKQIFFVLGLLCLVWQSHAQNEFITTWETTTADESITLPTYDFLYTYNYQVDWGDGTVETGLTGDGVHTYTTAGVYTVKISGTFPAMIFSNSGDKDKILSIEQWGNIQWERMSNAYFGCSNLVHNATDAPDLSQITTLSGMFRGVDAVNGDITHWDVSDITNLSSLFYEVSSFNQAIGVWDVSKVERMTSMFLRASSFNQDLSNWDMSNVESISSMFFGASSFNQDISAWDVSKVTELSYMFQGASSFNQDLSNWQPATGFNAIGMFRNATSFNQSLGAWDMSGANNITDLFDNSGLSTDNYDATLIGWAAQILPNDLTLGSGGLTYCTANTERQSIIDTYNWTVEDDAIDCSASGNVFRTTWETTTADETITLPTYDFLYTYNYQVDWGDGTIETGLTGDGVHTYTTAGVYTVNVSGIFPAMIFSNAGDKDKILSIEQWGNIQWERMSNAYFGCSNLVHNATDAPDLSQITTLSGMFRGVDAVNGDITHWDVSNMTNLSSLFYEVSSFNQAIGVWDVSKVERMTSMFLRASSFNQDLSNWDMSNVESISSMFFGASSFNQDISGWDVSKVTELSYMFQGASSFNQDLSSWQPATGFNAIGMFRNATSFNQNLGAWDMSGANNITNLFDNSGLSTDNYDATLIGWSKQTLPSDKDLGTSGIYYCLSDVERQKIIDDFNWTIDDEGVDASCLTTTTWSGSSWSNGMPTTGVLAILDADYDTYVDGELVADDLAIKPDYSLTVRGDSAVTMDGDLTNLGSIFIQDTTSFIQTATSPANTGDGFYSLEREGTDYRGAYNYWSSPVKNTTIEEVIGTTGRHFYTFDAVNQEWEGASTTEVLEAGLGFIATGTSITTTTIVRTFSDNTGFNSGDVTQSLSYSGSFDANDNWHLVGNPYPSGLDAISFLTDNAANIENAVYLWSSDGSDYHSSSSDYAVMTLAGSINAGGSGIAPTSTTISSAQGFFIQSKASGSVLFSNSQRVSTNNTFQRTHTAHMQRIWVGVEKDNGAKNEILLAFLDGAETEQDSYDANKLSGNSSVSLYTVGAFKSGTRPLAIQGLPALTGSTVVPMGIEAKEAGEFTFRLNHLDHFDSETEIYLADKETGSLVNIRTETYSVNLATGDYQDRFELRFVPAQVTSLEEEEAIEVGVRLFATEGEVKVQFLKSEFAEATVGVYEISGRLIGSYQNEADLEVGLSIPQTGIYIVKVANRYGTVSKKLFVD